MFDQNPNILRVKILGKVEKRVLTVGVKLDCLSESCLAGPRSIQPQL